MMANSDDSAKQPPVGIDLGTTLSVIAYLDPTGRPTSIANNMGDLLTPSAVYVDDDAVIVGKEAVKSSSLAPDRFADCFKRDLGAPFCQRKLHGRDVPPEVLGALVLRQLKRDAERRISGVNKVVITVPAFFDERRRRATQEAGRLAGLDVLDIINEPTAAALAYGYCQGFFNPLQGDAGAKQQRVLVYDLGGGTFDVTILEIDGARFRAVATDGDVWLGGKDCDQRLVDHLANQFVATHGIDPRSDPQDAAQLWLDAQEAKHALSERSKTTVVCFHAGIRMRIEVTRTQFEDLIRDLVERTETTTSLVVSQAGLTWEQIDRVLLIGGSSRIPLVRQMLRRVTGKEPDCSQSPDEAVAHGAALYAGMLMNQKIGDKPACALTNVNSHSLGVVGVHPKTKQRVNLILIPKNTPLPCQATRVFRTAKTDQRSVRVPVVEGESERPEDCIALGDCVVRDLPPGLPQGTRIEVEYRYAANGRISVLARVPTIRYSAHVEINLDKTRDLEDLQTWEARLTGHAPPSPAAVAAAGPVDVNDPASVMRRLDALYLRVGTLAVTIALPESLGRSLQSAQVAAAELAQAAARAAHAEQARQNTPSGAEAISAEALLAQARTERQQAQSRSDFAHLVLGRDCIDAGFIPPGADNDAREIRHLRQVQGA